MKINVGEWMIEIDGMQHMNEIQLLPAISILFPDPGSCPMLTELIGFEKDPTSRGWGGATISFLVWSILIQVEKGGDDEN